MRMQVSTIQTLPFLLWKVRKPARDAASGTQIALLPGQSQRVRKTPAFPRIALSSLCSGMGGSKERLRCKTRPPVQFVEIQGLNPAEEPNSLWKRLLTAEVPSPHRAVPSPSAIKAANVNDLRSSGIREWIITPANGPETIMKLNSGSPSDIARRNCLKVAGAAAVV